MPASIRPATTTDAEDISRLTGQLGYDLAGSDATERIRRIVSRQDERFLVAEVDGRPVAWVHAAIAEHVESQPFVMICGLVVDRNWRRRGIARMLMEQIEEWAKARGCPIVRLSSSATRTGAHRFYEQLGYENIKTQYSFAKALGGSRSNAIRGFVPRVDP